MWLFLETAILMILVIKLMVSPSPKCVTLTSMHHPLWATHACNPSSSDAAQGLADHFLKIQKNLVSMVFYI